ncbi:MAG: 1-acyl-sn-glycerol-3-phosphate acyltransferase [Lachnospiraceae bacterium]|nr:1-acyl-sn-glycerol-3-phosphate acyltransferase [Lachnospiraceae bacterium]
MEPEKKTAERSVKDLHARYQKDWRVLYAIAHSFILRRFNMTFEELRTDGPVLMVPNHVTSWDPLLVGMSLKHKQMYYVGSEHIFRQGLASWFLKRFLGPIARPKGGSGLETVRLCLEHLKAGHSVCLFAEGEASWDGQNIPIFPATGKLVKMSGASLVTYRLEGAFLSLPRWAKKIRRGKVYGHPVRIYSPEELAKMSAREINAAIEADTFEDAFKRQKEQPVAYRGKNVAEGLERALYLCPQCGRIGTLRTKKDRLSCSCGLDTRYTEYGFFDPAVPVKAGSAGTLDAPASFESFAGWYAWQKEELKRLYEEAPADAPDTARPDAPLFSDGGLRLTHVGSGHEETVLGQGTLTQYRDRLTWEDRVFPLDSIDMMAMVKANRLLFSLKTDYYEIVAKNDENLKKYLDLYNIAKH